MHCLQRVCRTKGGSATVVFWMTIFAFSVFVARVSGQLGLAWPVVADNEQISANGVYLPTDRAPFPRDGPRANGWTRANFSKR